MRSSINAVTLASALSIVACQSNKEPPLKRYEIVSKSPAMAMEIAEKAGRVMDGFKLTCILAEPENRKIVNRCRNVDFSVGLGNECDSVGCSSHGCPESLAIMKKIDDNPESVLGDLVRERKRIVESKGGKDYSKWICTNDIAFGHNVAVVTPGEYLQLDFSIGEFRCTTSRGAVPVLECGHYVPEK